MKLFYKDKNINEVDTIIKDIKNENGKTYVSFEKSLYYPQGGGQKGDKGYFVLDGIQYDILKTIKDENFDSYSIIDTELNINLIGKPVHCVLDRVFRDKQIKLHTCLHVYHMVMEMIKESEMDYPTLSTIEDGFAINKYKDSSFEYDRLEEVTSKFRELIQTDIEVVTYANEQDENYRYWKCMDSVIPCGGIHVSHLNEIGNVKVETKHKKKEITIRINLV